MQRNDLVIRIVERGANQIVHRRIDDDEILFAGALHVFHPSNENARVADHEPARFQKNSQSEWLKQRHQGLRVSLRSENVLCLLLLPPTRRAAFERRIVNDAKSSTDAEELEAVFGGELLRERQNFLHRQFERLHLRELRANVHLDAAQAQVLQFAHARIDAFDLLVGDAKFIFVSARRDFGVCARIHVWIHAHGDWSDLLETCRDFIDALQLRLALDVEGIDSFAQREFDLVLRLAHTGEDAFLWIATCGNHTAQFALAHDVETTAEVGEGADDREVRIRFHRKANEMVETAQLGVELAEMIFERVLRVHVKRRAVFLHERVDAHAFAEQLAADIPKIMHGVELCGMAGPKSNFQSPEVVLAKDAKGRRNHNETRNSG